MESTYLAGWRATAKRAGERDREFASCRELRLDRRLKAGLERHTGKAAGVPSPAEPFH
jgi:hypothetical protein